MSLVITFANRIIKNTFFISCLFSFSFPLFAVEITPYVGKIYGADFINNNGDDLSVENDNNLGLGIAWQDGPNGQGQVLITSASHEFETNTDNVTGNMDVIYAYFNGIAQFKQQDYITTVSLGLGGAYYDVENGSSSIFPSLTAALGTKYKIDDSLSFVTEIRSYITLTDEESDIFCQDNECIAEFESALWIETSLSVGVSYSF